MLHFIKCTTFVYTSHLFITFLEIFYSSSFVQSLRSLTYFLVGIIYSWKGNEGADEDDSEKMLMMTMAVVMIMMTTVVTIMMMVMAMTMQVIMLLLLLMFMI